IVQSEEDSLGLGESRLADFRRISPACGAIGGNEFGLPGAPDRHANGDQYGDQTTAARNGTTNIKNMRRVRVEEEPPFEQSPWVINRRIEKGEPGRTQA